MRVFLLNPELADRSCSDCVKYLYHDQGQGKFGVRVERPRGVPVLRPKGVKTPCRWCPKIPPGSEAIPENGEELSPKNFAAYCHYLECKSIGEYPPDEIVRRNAALIRATEDLLERIERQRVGLTVLNTLKGI